MFQIRPTTSFGRKMHIFATQNIFIFIISERDVAQWLERGALPMSLFAVRSRIRLSAGFSEKYNVSPFSILRPYFDGVSLGNALYPHMLHLIQV